MKICKKLKHAISFHVYTQDKSSFLFTLSILNNHFNKGDYSLVYVRCIVVSNMYKFSNEDLDVFLGIGITEDDSYLTIDSVEREMQLWINKDKWQDFYSQVNQLLQDNYRIFACPITMFISIKKYVLVLYNMENKDKVQTSSNNLKNDIKNTIREMLGEGE